MYIVRHEFGQSIHVGTKEECDMIVAALNKAGLNNTDKYKVVEAIQDGPGEDEEYPSDSYCNCPACPGGINHD